MKQSGKKLISVIIPAYNEEDVIEVCTAEIKKVMKAMPDNYELIFIDDGSKDRTLSLLNKMAVKDKHIKVISFARNFGHQLALTAGLDYAQGDAAVVIDADLQDPPSVIPQMVAKWKQGWNVVYGKRAKRKGETFFKRLTASMFYRLLFRLTDINIPLDAGDFRLIDRSVILAMRELREKNRFMRGLAAWIGFKSTAVEYVREKRFAGETKYPLFKMLKFAFDGITSFSQKPLKLALWAGIAGVTVGILLLAYAFYSYFAMQNVVSGWTSMLITVVFFGSVQLFTLGIIGEYIGRIHEEVKRRPLYVVEKLLNMRK